MSEPPGTPMADLVGMTHSLVLGHLDHQDGRRVLTMRVDGQEPGPTLRRSGPAGHGSRGSGRPPTGSSLVVAYGLVLVVVVRPATRPRERPMPKESKREEVIVDAASDAT